MKIEFDLKTITVAEAESVVWLLKQHIIPSTPEELSNAQKQLARDYMLSMANDVGIKPSAKKFGGDLPKETGDAFDDDAFERDLINDPSEEQGDAFDDDAFERDLINDPTTWGEELDAEGKPWDATIHTQNRSKTANGVWKKGRGKGVSPTLSIDEVLTEGFVQGGYAQPIIGSLIPSVPVIPPVPVAPAAPLAPAPPVPEVIPASAPPETQITFPQFLTAVTKEITRNTNFKNVSNDALNQLGLASIGQLNKAPEKMIDYIRITGLMI